MSSAIDTIESNTISAIPAQSEIQVVVRLRNRPAGLELRGRLTGPRCEYAQTVEISYPLKPSSRTTQESNATEQMFRAIVPEASLWEPASPFLYLGTIEVWQEGLRREQHRFLHGLRSFRFGPTGLRLNGRLLPLRGTVCVGEDVPWGRLREAGVNLLLAPLRHAGIWENADRRGFLVLGDCTTSDGIELSSTASIAETIRHRARHACCLGFRIPGHLLDAMQQTLRASSPELPLFDKLPENIGWIE